MYLASMLQIGIKLYIHLDQHEGNERGRRIEFEDSERTFLLRVNSRGGFKTVGTIDH